MTKRGSRRRVWFWRARAAVWLTLGVLSFPLGWAYSVAFVTIISIDALVTANWTTAEAADDRAVLDAIAELSAEVKARNARCCCCEDRQGSEDSGPV